MKKLIISGLLFSSLFFISNSVFAQLIPPAPKIIPGGTNYDKCLNIALLKRDGDSQKVYQVFNAAIQPQTDAMNKAIQDAVKFHGWLAWLNIFFKPSQKEIDSITKADQDLKAAIAKNAPIRDSALESTINRFSNDKQYCIAHQDQNYEWTAEQQKQLDRLEPNRK
jgi:hypothetical protein